jgi:nucleoid-associated protein YgaU
MLSKRKVILVVPERGKDIAGRKTKKPSGPLVMAVPRDEAGATTVLQRPETPLRPRTAPAKPMALARETKPVPIPDATASTKPNSAPSATAPAVAANTAGVIRDDEAASLNKLAPAAGADRPRGLLGIPQRPGKPVQTAARDSSNEPPASVLSLDAIDYDESGNLSMSGQAPEGTNVRVYLDNRAVGDAKTGEEGVWKLAPDVSVPPGLYRMRVDQVDSSGVVVARVETPFSRAGPLGDLPRDAVTFVQPGNSLWRIARRTLGEGVRYTVIFEANRDQIRNPDLIYPGQIFVVPKVN